MKIFFQGLQMHKSAYFNILLSEKNRGNIVSMYIFAEVYHKSCGLVLLLFQKERGGVGKRKPQRFMMKPLRFFVYVFSSSIYLDKRSANSL